MSFLCFRLSKRWWASDSREKGWPCGSPAAILFGSDLGSTVLDIYLRCDCAGLPSSCNMLQDVDKDQTSSDINLRNWKDRVTYHISKCVPNVYAKHWNIASAVKKDRPRSSKIQACAMLEVAPCLWSALLQSQGPARAANLGKSTVRTCWVQDT